MTETPTKASHACATCKHSHRRCDKQWPICGGCKSKGKKCSYDEQPKKPGPKPDYSHDILPTPTIESPTTIVKTPSFNVPSAVDQYFDSVCFNTPMFERKQTQDLLAYRKAVKNNTVHKLETMPSTQDLALLYALQG
jgi:hypothetical protein